MTISDITKKLKSDYPKRFAEFLPFILEHETVFKKGHWGNYDYVATENVSGDSGKKTRYGIDETSHPGVNIDRLTLESATAIYKEEWDESNAEKYPYPLGECFFDAVVNAGIGRAIKLLALAKGDANRFNKERLAFYSRLAEQKPILRKFLKGWNQRVADLNKFLGL